MILVTGAAGLIGSSAVAHFSNLSEDVLGIDNNSRREFFGPLGDVSNNLQLLKEKYPNFVNFEIDICDYQSILAIFEKYKPSVVIHTAAQPSHDRAATIPLRDFEVNALGTLNLLEATRLKSPNATFIHVSTNKVYGDGPNRISLRESKYRFDFDDLNYLDGIDESFPIDQSMHSLFGASKLSADIYAQEYGKYFGLNIGIFRGGCLTGPMHTGVELHGFLSHLVKTAVRSSRYTVFGYSGKQVRDQIHSIDVIKAFESFILNPHPGEVYNLGGGKANSASILEIVHIVSQKIQKEISLEFNDTPRKGDHICYYSNMEKFQSHFPHFFISKNLDSIIDEMIEFEIAK